MMPQARWWNAVIASSRPRTWEQLTTSAGPGTSGGRIFTRLTAVESVVHRPASDRTLRRSMATGPPGSKVLTEDNVFINLRKMEYAVRGPLLIRALEIEKELQKGAKKPFKEVIKANVGDAHAMGQQPITFLRQVLTLTVSPNLLDDPSYPEDVKERAKTILCQCKGGSVGSYSESAGIEIIRKHVAQYIQDRDGIPSDYHNIILSNGASDGIKSFLKLFNEKLDGKSSGVMIPIPQYPLYSATWLNLACLKLVTI